MNISFLFAVSVAGLVVCGAAAADPVATTAEAARLDVMVCRTMAPVTGTRLGGTRQCATQREWDRIHRDSAKALENTQKNTPYRYEDGG